MARTVIQHVEGGTSLGRVVRFTGLTHDMLLHPIVIGEAISFDRSELSLER